MSVLALMLAVFAIGAVVYGLELVTKHRERMLDLALRQDPHLYTSRIVELAVTGALVTRGHLEREHAEAHAELVREELERGLIDVGERVRPLDEVS